MARNEFPINYGMTAELIPLFKKELEFCKVKSDETVALFYDSRTNPHYPAAFMGAAMDIGAEVFGIQVPFFTQTTRKILRAASDDVIPKNGPMQAMIRNMQQMTRI